MPAPSDHSGQPPDNRSGGKLPRRKPGASPMAAAGAKAAPTTRSAEYRIKRLGVRRAWKSRSVIAIAAATGLLAAAGGLTFVSVSQSGHRTHASAAPSANPTAPRAVPASSASPVPARPVPSARRGPVGSLEVIGVGCPSDGDDAVTPDNAPAAPAWMPAGGGWTGDGCDGSTLWTMDPSGKPVPSTLTWRFGRTTGASRCTLAVFVPTQNALGVSNYGVYVGDPAAGQLIGYVSVSQYDAAGQWLTLGTFPVAGHPLAITTAPVPGAAGPGHHGAIAASAARASCT